MLLGACTALCIPRTSGARVLGPAAVAIVIRVACLLGTLCDGYNDGAAADRNAGASVLMSASLAVCNALPFSRWKCLRQVKVEDMPRVQV